MRKIFNLFIMSLVFSLLIISSVQASFLTTTKNQEITNNINNIASTTYPTETRSIESTIANIIQVVLGLLGIIFIVLMFKAGISWMTADGNEEKVTKAKTTIINLVIGLVLVFAAYIITYTISSIFSGTLLNNN